MEKTVGRASVLPFAKVRYVLIDLSGTLHVENDATPGAVEALEMLREAGVSVRFVTNTTKESKRLLFERLSNLGFKIQPDEIFTSLIAARQVIENLGVRPMFLVEDEALEDFTGIDTSDPNAVVVGLSPTNFCYDGLNAAFRLLLKHRTLIAIHKGKYFKRQAGLCLGPGPFVSALEFATGTEATVVGKPNARFFQAALSETSAEGCEVVMIGDDVQDDVFGAMDAGFLGILVQTGKYQPGDELKCSKGRQSFAVAENFASAVRMILAQRGVP